MDTVAVLARALRSGRLDAVDLTEEVLAGIAASDDPAIFIDVLAARARSEARAARRRLKAGTPASPIDGVPIGWKDLFDLQGRVTKAASRVLARDPPAARDAALVAAAGRAGLVSVGALNMTEFAYSGLGLNPHYGTPRNPRDPQIHRSPGGSSSASGAVVAKGLLPVAIGTDTGGSIRIPASFNGVVGFKTSTSHYPMAGVFPLSRTFDTLGPLGQSVEDCALVDAALRGVRRVRKADLGGVRFLVPDTVVNDGAEPEVLANFEASLRRLGRAGGHIRRVSFPVFDAILKLVAERGHILGAEALHVHQSRVNGPDAREMDARVVRRIRLAETMTAVDLVEVMTRRRALIAEARDLVGDAFVLFPTTPHVAPPIAPLEADMEEFFRVNARTLRNTMLGNFLEWCGLSIPSGNGAHGMPTGFLINATHGRDADLLAIGLATEHLIRGD